MNIFQTILLDIHPQSKRQANQTQHIVEIIWGNIPLVIEQVSFSCIQCQTNLRKN